jgi:hypothetical protein
MTETTPPFGQQHVLDRGCACTVCTQAFYLERRESRPEVDKAFDKLKVRDAVACHRCGRLTANAIGYCDQHTDSLKAHATATDKEPSAQKGNGTPFMSAVGTDNWVHRSVGMKCSTCMWYSPKVGRPISDEAAAKLIEGRGAVGRCRKHSPTLQGWPVMYAADWCGDHKLDEEKVNGNA